MTDTVKPRARRTFSAFGEIRRMPSEYEIVTQGQNWTARAGRAAAFEANPSSPANLWFRTYRDNTPLKVADWERFREPDSLTYQAYVRQQSESQSKVDGVLEEYAALGSDQTFGRGWLDTLASLYTPSRYLFHGFQQVEAYIGYLAPSAYLTNPAGLCTADYLRRVTTIAYRTRELQLAHPDLGFGTDNERKQWEGCADWQPVRKAVEYALVTYDWGEAFTALNLVLAPTIDEVMSHQFGEVARANGDQLDWLLSGFLQADNDRRTRWSVAAARFAVAQDEDNREVLRRWFGRWASIADDAARGLANLLGTLPDQRIHEDVIATAAAEARDRLLSEILSPESAAAANG